MDRERGSVCPTASQPRAGEPLGHGPAPIGAPPARPTPGVRDISRLAAVLAAVAVAGVLTGTSPAGAVETAPAGPSAPLSLAAQTAYVTAAQPAFDVRVTPGRGNPPAGRLGLTVAVYACLSSVSAFDQSVNSPSGPAGTRISATRTPVPLDRLPVSGGVYDLSMPVTGVGGATAPTSPGGFAIDLSPAGAQCSSYPSGVYPVRVELVDTTSGQALGGFTTHLVYADPPAGTERLRVALVLPVQTTLQASSAPTPTALRNHPGSALAPPSEATLDALAATVNIVATTRASVPVTLEASPQTLLLLESTGHAATVAQLASLAAGTAGGHQIAESPFVPVDAAGLVGAGLEAELALQVAQGVQVLDATVTRPPSGPVAAVPPLGAWFSDTTLDPATLTELQAAGYSQLVLPAASLATVPTNGSTAVPFTVSSSRGTPMTALAYNGDLSARFPGPTADAVLAAHQLVAELAQTYYEKPNGTVARGVVAIAPGGWVADPAFVDALLGALQSSPIAEPVTTADLFTTLGPATPCRTCRLVTPSGGTGLPVAAIRTERQRINGLVTAAPAARPLGTQLSEVLLSGQAETLRSGQQSAVVANASAAVNAQLAQIAVAGDRTVTLTSHTGRVPITIVSAAPYPIDASMTLTSDKLLFANHSTTITEPVTLLPAHTNVIPVSVQSRASGQFKLDIVLRAPGTAMVLSSGQVSVRSTATSVVGIVLSLGAVVVLVAWWVRTSRKRRRTRREEAVVVEEPAEPVVTG